MPFNNVFLLHYFLMLLMFFVFVKHFELPCVERCSINELALIPWWNSQATKKVLNLFFFNLWSFHITRSQCWNIKSTFTQVLVLYLRISIYFRLLLHFMFEANIVHFTPLHLSDSFLLYRFTEVELFRRL